jgi:thiol-disulfide isomerase/thioredoxin
MNRFIIQAFILISITFLLSCKHQNKPTTDNNTINYQPVDTLYYKNIYTNKIIRDADMRSFVDSLNSEYSDSILGTSNIIFLINKTIEKKDSVIRFFTYDVRVGLEYLVRSREYPKIGMTIPATKFKTINGDSVQIGGVQDKPTVINLWFLKCGGCIAEIPALNRLYEKYAYKVNFIALTFDNEKDVRSFLNKMPYNYTHIASEDGKDKENNIKPFIESIESYPYPENIFVDKLGTIKYIEGGLGNMENLDIAIKHFEMILQDLLNAK